MKDLNRFLCVSRLLPEIVLPVKAATRVKYQCIAVSNAYICVGASTGSTYVFERSNATLIKFISNKLSGIVAMAFSNNEHILAIADSAGLVTCWEVDEFTHNFKKMKEIESFCGHVITAMCWSDTNSRIFIGGQNGQVISFSIGLTKSNFSKSSVEVILKSGEPVVQMAFSCGKLLVSSKVKTILCVEEKDGLYGSCYLKDTSNVTPVIYSARPGSRLWEVDFDGQVLSTHQFKELLAVPPSPIITSSEFGLPEPDLQWCHPQTFNFPQLYPIMGRYLLTWSSRGIYIFEPKVRNVAIWNDQIKDIIGVSYTGYDLYFLHSDCSVSEVSLLNTKECLLALKKMEEWKKLLEFACDQCEEIFGDVESFIAMDFHDILAEYKESSSAEENLIKKVEEFINKLEGYHAEVRAKVEERLNQMWTITDTTITSESTQADDADEIRSNFSGGSAGSSSRMSLSMMSEISLNSFWQKATSATNIVVSKVMPAGLKKSFQSALEEEGVYLDYGRNDSFRRNVLVEQKEFSSAPNSPKTVRKDLQRAPSTKSLDTNVPINVVDVPDRSPTKAYSFPNLQVVDKDGMSFSKDVSTANRPPGTKIRKKKKVKVINIDSPASEEPNVVIGTKFEETVTPDPAKVPSIPCQEKPVTTTEFDCISPSTDDEANLQQSTEIPFESTPPEVAAATQATVTSVSKVEKQTESSTSPSTVVNEDMQIQLPSDAVSLVNKLLNTTAATRNDIRDPVVLYNSKAIHDLLQRWANKLEKIEKEFSKECFNDLSVLIQDNVTTSFLFGFEMECRKLLFTQLASAFGEISNVAMLCFETNIFPKYCSMLRYYEVRLLNSSVTMGEVQQQFRTQWKSLSEEQFVVDSMSVEIPVDINKDLFVENNSLIPTINLPKESVEENSHKKVKPVPSNDSLTASFDCCDLPAIPAEGNEDIAAQNEEVLDESASESQADQISLSTVLSKSENDITDLDLIVDTEFEELIEKDYLCENFDIGEGDECQSCLMDKCRACFVLRYFPVLNFTRMRSLLLWNGGCRWRTWLACMLHLTELHKDSKIHHLINNGSTSIYSELKQNNVEIFLASVGRLYTMSPELVLDYINEDHLTPFEITLLYHTGHLPNCNIDDFLQYSAEHLLASKIDPLFVTNVVISALKQHPSKDEVFCSCGKARPGSNTIQWKWQHLLLELIAVLRTQYMPIDNEMLAKLSQYCAKSGFWLGYIHLLTILNDERTIMSCVYQLGDNNLLRNLIDKGALVPNDDMWTNLIENICEVMEANDDHKCTPIDNWCHSLTLENLLRLVGIYSGSKFCLSMIHKFPQHNILSPDIYISLVKASELENKQESLVSRLIEVASGKLWSDKKPILQPHFEYIKDCDIKNIEIEALSVCPSSFKPNEYIMEESDPLDYEFYKAFDNAECPVCTLPLCLKTMTSSTAGLVVLQCGHGFHKVCLPENACLVCFHDNFTSLYGQ